MTTTVAIGCPDLLLNYNARLTAEYINLQRGR